MSYIFDIYQRHFYHAMQEQKGFFAGCLKR